MNSETEAGYVFDQPEEDEVTQYMIEQSLLKYNKHKGSLPK